jgi:hypothetical protein
MNTTEINGSNWPIKYYVIASVPLTIVTLLVPLYAIQTFNFLVLRFQTSAHRLFLKWGLISAAFTFQLLAAMCSNVLHSGSMVMCSNFKLYLGLTAMFIVSCAVCTYTAKLVWFIGMNRGLLRVEFWRALYSNYRLWPLFCYVTLILQFLSLWQLYDWFYGLVPFFIYFFIGESEAIRAQSTLFLA